MVTIDKIKDEILNYAIQKNIIEVEFEDYFLEVDLKDMEGLEINLDNIAKIIAKKYR